MSSLPEDIPVDRPTPLWPWILVSAVLFVMGLYFLRPDPSDIDSTKLRPTPRPSRTSSPTPRSGASDFNLPPEGDTLRLLYVDSADSSFGVAARHFCEEVDKNTQGRVKITPYAFAQVGDVKLDELGIIEGMQRGAVSFAFVTCSPLTNISPRLEILDLPFLFRDPAHADRVLLGPTGKKMMDTFKGSGLLALGTLEVGFRVFSSSLPLLNMEDFKGKRLRVMQSAASISMVRTLGAEAVPSPVNKVYQMAKEGYIDAADRTYPTYWDFKLYEVHRHISETQHSYTAKFILTTDKFFKSLSDADRKAIQDAVAHIEVEERKLQRAEDLRVKAECEKMGIKIHPFSPQERERIAQACKSLYDEYVTLHGIEFLEETRNSKQ